MTKDPKEMFDHFAKANPVIRENKLFFLCFLAGINAGMQSVLEDIKERVNKVEDRSRGGLFK